MSKYHISFGVKENNETEVILDTLAVKKAALILRAFNNKLRQEILELIGSQVKIAVTEIYVKLKIEQAVASAHLAILRKADFVEAERNGRFIYYTVNIQRMKELSKFTEELIVAQ